MFKREEVAPRCRRLSDPAHPHTLCRRDNPRPSLCFRCGPVNENDEDYDWNNIHYYCEICKLVFHEDCYMFPQGAECMWQDPPFTIINSGSHEHPLTLFPRPLTEPCSSVCVLGGNMEVGYACDPCNYLVHLKCIQPPQAIHQDCNGPVPGP
ncbi:hypothetical protein DY000_02057347 [Brassica cretica]|uniref:Phorbol-ester/DAG-type domain-containing protein n=1 Tax=Brassica cretica TaxID=69181 RepID=A0ABQ7AL43_BRACR|nr:hypothetical protein DY000_02057347 [Brassica cretica]